MLSPDTVLPYRLRRGLIRAVRRRCPLCGSQVFRSWLRILPRCDHCGFRTDRGESDYYFGAWTIGFIAAEFLVFAAGGVWLLATWPDVNWTALQVGVLLLAIPVPLLTIPFSRTVWLALDLAMRPPAAEDFG